jgi:hypothetical protein
MVKFQFVRIRVGRPQQLALWIYGSAIACQECQEYEQCLSHSQDQWKFKCSKKRFTFDQYTEEWWILLLRIYTRSKSPASHKTVTIVFIMKTNYIDLNISVALAFIIFLSAEQWLIKAEEAQIDELEECLRDFDTEIVGLGGISLLGTMDSVSSYDRFIISGIFHLSGALQVLIADCRLQVPAILGGSRGQEPARL